MTANLKNLMKDERVAAVHAIVSKPADKSSHWDVITQPDGQKQLLVHVITKGSHTPLWCHAQGGTRTGRGSWSIPDVKTEVIVGFDDGEFEGDGFICGEVGRLADSLGENQTLILDALIELRSVGGTAEKMLKGETYRGKEDLLFSAIVGAITLIQALVLAMSTDPLLASFCPLSSAAAITANAGLILPPIYPIATALSQFNAAASTYLATVGKVE